MKDIVVIGTGGFGREVMMLIEQINKENKRWNVLGFIDDYLEPGITVNGYKVIGNVEYLINTKDRLEVCIGIGSSKGRREVASKLRANKNLSFPRIISPDVFISDYVDISEGVIVCSGVIMTVNITLEKFCTIDRMTTIGHDCVIGEFASIRPCVSLSGDVNIGSGCEIGVGSVVIEKKSIGENTIIGAGGVVIRDIEENKTAVGVPARVIK